MSADLLLQMALAWLLLLIVSVALFEVCQPWLRGPLRRAAMAGRLLLLVTVSWLPILVATLVLAGCYAPWVLASVVGTDDHCFQHSGHIHLCVEHVYAAEVSLLSWGLLAAIASWLVLGLYEIAVDVRRGAGLQRSLSALAEPVDGGFAVVEANAPSSLTVGLWSPRIFMTSALLALLSGRQRRAVIAHERCHADERHALLKLLAALGAVVLRRSTRRALLAEVALACERRSDEAAAEAIGDRLDVATTLIATRRALRQRQPIGVLGLHGGGGFEARIRGLVEKSHDPGMPVGSLASAVTLAGGLGLVIGHELHHGMEVLLSVFLF